ncbi:MAG: hypothetical protein V4636_19970 [Pseudomonadota bacterium]
MSQTNMKEFHLCVKCNTAAELQDALERTAAEIASDYAAIDEALSVDGMIDMTTGDAESIELWRVS